MKYKKGDIYRHKDGNQVVMVLENTDAKRYVTKTTRLGKVIKVPQIKVKHIKGWHTGVITDYYNINTTNFVRNDKTFGLVKSNLKRVEI